MKTSSYFSFLLSALVLPTLIFSLQPLTASAQGTAFTYQGRLTTTNGPSNGNYNLTFALFNASSGGGQLGSTIQTNGVVVSNGLFMVTVDFGTGIFNGTTCWLQIGVETNGAGGFTTLTPRQQLTPTPYAIYAEGGNAAGLTGTVPPASLSGAYSGAVSLNNSGNSFSGNGGGLTDVNAAMLAGLTANNFWQTTGNAGTTAGVNFVGTTDNQPLEFHVNGTRALRLEPGSLGGGAYYIPNVIGGLPENYVGTGGGAVGNFIGGGGDPIAAGGNNYIAGESMNVIGGGSGNHITNSATTQNATIGGGFYNTIIASYGTISGGFENTVTSLWGTVPGGYSNIVEGEYGFAAGRGAQVFHNGTFIWADDSTNSFFGDTSSNQFLIRAAGGVGINTIAPAGQLDVEGSTLFQDGIYVTTPSADGNGIQAVANNGIEAYGVWGQSTGGYGVVGTSSGTGTGVWGDGESGGYGVEGTSPSGIAVYGNSTTGTGVVAVATSGTGLYASSGSGSALTIGSGAIHVTGAGIGANTAAFIQLTAAANIDVTETIINNSLCNGDPNAILIVTHNDNPGGVFHGENNHVVGVFYNGSQWTIYNEDNSQMATNLAFNVLVIKN